MACYGRNRIQRDRAPEIQASQSSIEPSLVKINQHAVNLPTKLNDNLCYQMIEASLCNVSAITFQRLQPVSWRNSQIVQAPGDFQLPEFPPSHGGNVYKFSGVFPLGQGLRVGALKRYDHAA